MSDSEKPAEGKPKTVPARGGVTPIDAGGGPMLRLGGEDFANLDSAADRTRVPALGPVLLSKEVEGFLNVLGKSKLLDEKQRVEASKLAESLKSVPALVAELVGRNWLTAWQAERLVSGQSAMHLGKYCLLRKLGEGGMGAVYEARQGVTDRVVAVKVMSAAIAKNPNLVARFHREVQAAVALNHPNIVTAYDADSAGSNHFLVMEYVRGQDLSEWLATHGKLPVVWACECIRQACLGLEHAFEKGLVHRDLKPSNLLVIGRSLEEAPVIKILDMGLARFEVEGESNNLTHTGQVLGTPHFISPEQAKNTKNADIRSDIYSLGCTLFKMLSGENVFLGATVTEQLAARFEGPARSLGDVAPDVPREVVEIVDMALQKYPEDRYQTPREMGEALEGFLATQPPLAGMGGASGAISSGLLPRTAGGRAKSTVIPSDSPTMRLNRPAGTGGAGRGRRAEVWMVLAGLAVLALVVTAAVQFVLKTPRGTILVEVSQPDATITVEDAAGGKIKLSSPKLAEPVSIEIPEGKNVLKVDKEGFQGFVEEFTISHSGQKIFQVKLEPLAARPVLPDPIKKPPVKPVDPVDPAVKTVTKDPGTKVPLVVTPPAGAGSYSKLVKKITAVRTRPVYGLAISPDHKLVACGSAGEQLVLYDFESGNEVARLPGHKDTVAAVLFSSDGRTLYSAGRDNAIRLWDVESRDPKGTLEGHNGWVNDIMFLLDGQTLASCSHDKTVRLWKEGKQVKSLDDTDKLMDLDVSADGKLLATIGLGGDLTIWNLETLEFKCRWKAHTKGHGVAFSPAGDLVASSSASEKVAAVWEVKSQKQIFRTPEQADAANVLTFAPSGRLLVCSNVVQEWDVSSKQASEALANDDPCQVNSIRFSPDKKLLLTGDVRGKVRIYAAP